MLTILACHSSIRAGQTLSPDEMRQLLVQLEQCQAPRTCPHGRPTMILLSTSQLERQFGRIK
jgi:DNA mismatch repair protein MutL